MQQASAKVRHTKLRRAAELRTVHSFNRFQVVEVADGQNIFIPQQRIRDHRSGVSSLDCLDCGRSLIVSQNGAKVFGSAEISDCR